MAEKRVQRRLAAILAADVVGYSRLMREDETGTLAQLKTLRKEVFDPRIAEHNGRIVKTTGDGILAEFASAVDATECAVKIQQALARRNEDVPEGHRIELRIGINLGDIIVDGDDIYGDGVNVAARLEALCDTGEVYVSAAVHDQVEGKIQAAFDDLGEHTVKNIDKPIGVFRISSGVRPAVAGRVATEVDKLLERPAVAVMPFENIGGDPEQEYFADGLIEDIITALSLWRSFPVIARNSTFTFKGRAVRVQEVAQELGARYIVEGSVRKDGNRIRVTAQLIDAKTGHHVWAERYDRELEDTFTLQDELTQGIVSNVAPELERAEQSRIARARPSELDAWDCHQRGMSQLGELTQKGNYAARKMFERAIEIDPNYSRAYGGLAFAHMREIWLGFTEDVVRSLEDLQDAARRSVSIDAADPFSHVMLSIAHQMLGNLDIAVNEAERAVALNPNDSFGHSQLGHSLAIQGDLDNGIHHSEIGLQLNPLDPRAHVFQIHIAIAHFIAHRHEHAAEWARKSVHGNPEFAEAYMVLAASNGELGDEAAANAALQACLRLDPDYVEKWPALRSYFNRAQIELFLDGLRKAGWEG